jgi:NADH-quinone oxidoreductase subunit L
MVGLAGYIVLFPLAGFLVNGILGKKIGSEKISGLVGSGAVGLSFLLSASIFAGMLGSPAEGRSHVVTLFTWVAAGSLSVSAAYRIDQLSIILTLIITGVGFLIHLYSIGYMHDDPAFWRFFTYLNLFIFMMLNLVLADNFLLMFLGWEGVGLCSYLLIGFWHDRPFDTGGYPPGTATTSDAARKAFIVNRIGDFGFLLAIFLIFKSFGSISFGEVFPRAAVVTPAGESTIFWITLLLFVGATGKSAQIPLYVWLPDAMAGPTPVSALIHAATMVTAGIYMIARCSILYALSPATMHIVAVVGLFTAIFAATIGLVQNDIKKVLAYSTISQLGYMFMALGVGAFSSGIFHLMTHAFFKALLFLGAGAVIHAMHGDQDIQKMGGLRTAMPVTRRTFLIGALAIAGIPPLSGFFSKDAILLHAFSGGGVAFWIFGWITAGLTAFYMFRLFYLTFEGEARWSPGRHPHEMPGVMTVPLMILALLSAIGGLAGVPVSLAGGEWLDRWLEPVFEKATARMTTSGEAGLPGEYLLMLASVAIAAGGIYCASLLYRRRSELAARLAASFGPLYKLALHKYYVDEMYEIAIVVPMQRISRVILSKGVDTGLIDGLVNGSGRLIEVFSRGARRLQTGVAQSYALAFVAGIILILALLVFR